MRQCVQRSGCVLFPLSTVRNAFWRFAGNPVTLMCGLGDSSRFALDVKNFISVVREIFSVIIPGNLRKNGADHCDRFSRRDE